MLYTIVSLEDIFNIESNILYEKDREYEGFFSTNPYDFLKIT